MITSRLQEFAGSQACHDAMKPAQGPAGAMLRPT